MAALAATVPSLLSYNVPPSPTFWNQALAVALWGWFVVAAAPAAGARWRGGAPLLAALAVVLATVLWSWGPGALPAGLALSAVGLLLAAAVLAAAGAAAHARPDATAAFGDFCVGWAVAGVCNVAIALIQVFASEVFESEWIAQSAIPGRAVGNLRQPNHLSSLLLWSAIAVVALLELRRIGRVAAAALLAALVFAVVLTASRTGLVSIALLALWGAVDRRLTRPTRLLLLAAPAVYAAGWMAMAEWARASAHTFAGSARLAEADISGSRFGIWRNTLDLIAQQPWAGVGFGEFNYAWTLTPFPGRPIAFFDHTHNLPLQLAVEIGLPLAAGVVLLLGWALFAAARNAWRAGGDAGIGRRAALAMVLMIGLHSQLEYPLWYAYFLLPAAWAWGWATGQPARAPAAADDAPAATRPDLRFVVAGALLAAGAVLAALDYRNVTAIFSADEGAPPLADRVARGQRSVLFAHHADYAAATTAERPSQAMPAFLGAPHYLLDSRLMQAWATALNEAGDTEHARYVAQRLREFRNAGSAEFFALCAAPALPGPDTAPATAPAAATAATLPFQCQAPGRAFGYESFR